jgi:DNA-binding NarL/FixJ family response regulator
LALAEGVPEPDLVLLDLNMPGMNGLQGLKTLRSRAPTVPVAMLSAETDKQTVMQSISLGAVGYLNKSAPREKLDQALQMIMAGHIYLPPDILQAPDAAPTATGAQASAGQLMSLTRKQLLVLEAMVTGASNKQIAYQLNIAEATVKAHVTAILSKLSVSNRVQAMLAARDVDFSDYLKR